MQGWRQASEQVFGVGSLFPFFHIDMVSGNEHRSSGHATNAFELSCWPHGCLAFVTVFSAELQILWWCRYTVAVIFLHLERARLFTKESCFSLISLNPPNQTVRDVIHSPPAALMHTPLSRWERLRPRDSQQATGRLPGWWKSCSLNPGSSPCLHHDS